MQLQADPNKWIFWCPACKHSHWFDVTRWTWDGDREKPTVHASILNIRNYAGKKPERCHIMITKGQIEYFGDCLHEFAGKVIPMVDIPGTVENNEMALAPFPFIE